MLRRGDIKGPTLLPKGLNDQSRLKPGLRVWLTRIGFLVGLALLVGAIIMVWQEHERVAEALDAMRNPAPGLVVLLIAGVVANVLLTGLLFSLLVSRYGHVGLLEMQAVMAAAMLLNFLPARPGLFGRIAYHRAVNRIRTIDSGKTIIQASVLSLCISGYLGAVVVLSRSTGLSLWYGGLLPIPILIGVAQHPRLRIWALAALVRYFEVHVWSVRYLVSFALIDSHIDPNVALALACLSVITTMMPFVSNGLGLREWTIGLLLPTLTAYSLQLGVTAELVNRAAEIVVIVVLGLAGIGWLTHRRKHYVERGRQHADS
jgi:hypothetical protein